jgi:hypothetical protein
MIITQIDVLIDLLNRTNVGAIGLLLAICFLLVWDKVRNEKKYSELLKEHHKEQEENKKILIEISTKSIAATEKIIQTINNIKDVINAKK